MIKIKPVVPKKNAKKWKNFETLQLAAEYHSINKNQSLIKINTSSSWEKCKKSEENLETLQLAAECHGHKQKSKFDQDEHQ